MKLPLFYIALLFFIPIGIQGQDSIDLEKIHVLHAVVDGNDTILVSTIEEIYILPMPKFKTRRDLRRYRKLVRNVKKVYPYAKLASKKYEEVVANVALMETEKEKKKYMKQVEQEIKDEFEDDLRKLTISQGRILLKLIDRETGETSYELVKEFRGSFSAVFWQALARLFGNNLKSTFDAEGEDRLLNEIVLLIENGQI